MEVVDNGGEDSTERMRIEDIREEKPNP